MSKTKRAQVLMDPEEYEQLEGVARQQGVSVAELVRQAIRDRFFLAPRDRERILDDMFSMNLPVDDWETLEREIEEARSGGVS